MNGTGYGKITVLEKPLCRYRCRYCWKFLADEKLTTDELIAVMREHLKNECAGAGRPAQGTGG